MARCIAILKSRLGYDGFLSLEYEGTEDCIEGIRRGLENLKDVYGLNNEKAKEQNSQPKPHKDVFWQGYGVTPQSGLHCFLFSGGKPVFLRVCFDFSHKAFDFILCGNVNQSDSREVNVHLHIAMTA